MGELTDASNRFRYLQDRMMAGNFYDPGIQMGIITDLDLLAHQERIFEPCWRSQREVLTTTTESMISMTLTTTTTASTI